jgi:hypothetical protein
MDIKNLSIIELKQLLSRVNQDLAAIKRAERTSKRIKALSEISEGALCNKIAANFTGKSYDKPVENAKIIADIQIQQDILDYLNTGGHIITTKSNKLNSKALRGARSGMRLYRRFN